MNLNLEGKKALIAGSSAGIGLATAQALAEMGATCTLLARNKEKLEKAVASLNNDKAQQHQYLVADFSKSEVLKTVVNKYMEENDVDILINNTGGPPAGPIIGATVAAFLDAYEQHLVCNHILTQAVVNNMKKNGYGRIVNVISTSIKIPLKGLGVSNTTRGAVAAWSKTMALELAPFGITVNNVLPGATSTERLTSIIDNKSAKLNKDKAEVEAAMLGEIPMGRFGKPEEVAAMAAFFCSPAASYITGVSVQVDGGRTGSLT